MAGVADTNIIDIVARDAAGQVLVVMVETRRWSTDPAQQKQLREKINVYAAFILDGGLVRRYPETAGQKVIIQLDCPEAPSGASAILVAHAVEKLAAVGVGFRVNVRS
jgi:RecB family endonuclease NucS